MNPRGSRAALEVVHTMIAAAEAEREETAQAWTVMCRDREFGLVSLHGVFDSPLAASEYAAKWGAELNHDAPPDGGWELTVHCISPAEKEHQ